MKGAFGFNVATEEFENQLKAGIIDPTKVVRTTLQNAASVSRLLLTTEAMIAGKPEDKKPAAPAPHPEGWNAQPWVASSSTSVAH